MLVLSGLVLLSAGSLLKACFTSVAIPRLAAHAILIYADDGVYLVDRITAETMPGAQSLAYVDLIVTDSPTSRYSDIQRLDRRFSLRAGGLRQNRAGEVYPGAEEMAASLAPEYFASTPIGQIEGFDAARLVDGAYRATKTNPIGVAHWAVCLTIGSGTSVWWLTRGRKSILDAWAARQAAKKRLCETCGYDLSGLKSDRCPECGASSPRTAPKD